MKLRQEKKLLGVAHNSDSMFRESAALPETVMLTDMHTRVVPGVCGLVSCCRGYRFRIEHGSIKNIDS